MLVPRPVPATLSAMETRRWTNPSQPQTLYMATFLLYINAVLRLRRLLGGFFGVRSACWSSSAQVAAGFGIANEKQVGLLLGGGHRRPRPAARSCCSSLVDGVGVDLQPRASCSTPSFPVALFALLVHPMSREYQKIWFH